MGDLQNLYLGGLTTAFTTISQYMDNFYANYYETIKKAFDVISVKFAELAKNIQKWNRPYMAIQKLSEHQYVFWDYFDDKLIDLILDSNNINKTLRELNLQSNFADIKGIAQKCLETPYIKPYEKLFTQSMKAFESGNSELSVIGFLSIIDGLLSDVSNDQSPKIFQRADAILKKLEDNGDIDNDEFSVFVLLVTFRKTMESLSTNIKFSEKEPKKLNRHWIMHGRSRRRKTKLDCVKIIRFIYGIILIAELSKKEAEKVNGI